MAYNSPLPQKAIKITLSQETIDKLHEEADFAHKTMGEYVDLMLQRGWVQQQKVNENRKLGHQVDQLTYQVNAMVTSMEVQTQALTRLMREKSER